MKIDSRERLKRAVFSAASLIQNDPEISEETKGLIEHDLKSASRALDEIIDFDPVD